MADDGERDRREATIRQAMSRLEEYEAAHPEQPYATVLQFRLARPKASMEVLAQEFSHKVGSPVSTEEFRGIMQLARKKFLDLFSELENGRP